MTKSIFLLCSFLLFSGLVSSQIYSLSGTATAAQEVPPTMSMGTATVSGTFDAATNEVTVSIPFSGLTGNSAAAHIHAAPAGSNGGVILALTIPTGVTSGTVTGNGILSAADAALLTSGGTYLNIHSSAAPGGEIRAQITATAPSTVPTLGQWGIMSLMILIMIFTVVAIKENQTNLTNRIA